MQELQGLLAEEDLLKAESFNISEETREQQAFLTDPAGVAKSAREVSTYLYSEDKTATREFLRFFIRRVDLFESHGKIEYSLPLPDAHSTNGGQESKIDFLDHEVLLQPSGPSPRGRGVKFCFAPFCTILHHFDPFRIWGGRFSGALRAVFLLSFCYLYR